MADHCRTRQTGVKGDLASAECNETHMGGSSVDLALPNAVGGCRRCCFSAHAGH